MRIPFPERIPLSSVATFAGVLFLVQWLEGTALYFAGGCVVFILISALAFNAAGGLTRASGAYVFFYSVLVVIIGVTYKAYLGEPGQSNLLDPKTDIEVYVGGIAAMYAAVIVSRRFSRRKGLLEAVLADSTMYRASIGCLVIGITGIFALALLGESGARLASAFVQLNQLLPLGIIIGVIYEIRHSGGTRSINLPILVAAIYFFFFYGVLGFSKQGMLTPALCWFVPVCTLRYRLSTLQVLACLVATFLLFHYLVPYSQYGRRFAEAGQTLQQKVDIATRLLGHPEETRNTYEADTVQGGYYNTQQGFWDRLQFVSIDDSLVDITDQGKVFGLLPLQAQALNAIPHVFWPNKPNINFGNLYAHEIGGVNEEDTSTGISFSPTAEAFHLARWTGVLVIAPLLWFLVFVVFDSLIGDLRSTPWGLLTLMLMSHAAPEFALVGTIILLTTGVETLLFCAFVAIWVAPLFASFALGPERRSIDRPAAPPARANPTGSW